MLGSERTNSVSNNQVPRAEAIARLNDKLRTTCCGGHIMVTRGVGTLDGFSAAELIAGLRSYDGFDIDNDPHGERDVNGGRILGQRGGVKAGQ